MAMKTNKIKNALPAGLIVAVTNFILLYIGVRFILGNTVDWRNIIAYTIVSLIIGVLSFALFLIKPRVGFYIFDAGILLAFVYMFYVFSKDSDGWGDLAGLMSFFMIVLIALGIALLVQLIIYAVGYKRVNSKPDNDSR